MNDGWLDGLKIKVKLDNNNNEDENKGKYEKTLNNNQRPKNDNLK